MFLLADLALLCILLQTQKGIFDLFQLTRYRLICLFQQLICFFKFLPILFVTNMLSLFFILLVRVPLLVKLSVWIIWKLILLRTYLHTLIEILILLVFDSKLVIGRTYLWHQIAKDGEAWYALLLWKRLRTLGLATAVRCDQWYRTLLCPALEHGFVHLWDLFYGLDIVGSGNFLQKSHFLKFRFRTFVSLEIVHGNLPASVLQGSYAHTHSPHKLKIPHHNQPFKLLSFFLRKTLIRQFRLRLTFQLIVIFVLLDQRFLARTDYWVNHSFGRFLRLLEYFVRISLFLRTQVIDLRL